MVFLALDTRSTADAEIEDPSAESAPWLSKVPSVKPRGGQNTV